MPPPTTNEAPKFWKLGATGKLDGSRAKVRETIAADQSIPKAERDYLLAKIDSRPAEHNWITVLAHSNEHSGKSVLDLDIESSTENI